MQGPIDSIDFSDLKSLAQQDIFRFKRFEIHQKNAQMKVNTDAVLLGCWSNVQDKKKSLDIGTGTGVIALMMAQRNPNLISWGIDIDQNSADIAELNMKKSPFFKRMISKHISVQDLSHELPGYFDLIVSNPPFFSGGTFSSNENKGFVRHTIKLSHSDLLLSVKRLMATDGHFDVILPYIEGLRFLELAAGYGLYPSRFTEVYTKKQKPIERLLLSLCANKTEDVHKNQIVLHDAEGIYGYSSDYTELSRDFYLFL